MAGSVGLSRPCRALLEDCDVIAGHGAAAEALVPFVSIIIPAFNAARTIGLCLNAIQQLDYPRGRFEVIVVDNNSTDGTAEIVKEYPVRILYERKLQGPHAATNTGVREAKGALIAFTDSDCVVERSWLCTLVAPFADQNVVGVGGRIEAFEPKSRVERFLADEIKPFTNCVRMTASFPAALLTGNAAYRADALRAAGLFNPSLYTGAEVDLAWRVQWQTGKQVVYAPDAVVYHKFSPSVRRLFRHFRIYGYSEIILATLYKDVSGYPRPPKVQLKLMQSQIRALFTYLISFSYRTATRKFRGRGAENILTPLLWFVAESGSISGKLEALWATRFYSKVFWANGPRVI